MHRLGLSLAEFRPIALAGLGLRRLIVCQLDPVEGEVPLTLLLAPLLDQEWKEDIVLVGLPRITFALIPDDSLDAVAECGIDHAGKDIPGTMLVGEEHTRITGLAWKRFFLRLVLVTGYLPSSHLFFIL